MDEKKAEITRCSFSQTCSSPGAPELHECRYGSSLIQFLLDYMHIRNALTPELDRPASTRSTAKSSGSFLRRSERKPGSSPAATGIWRNCRVILSSVKSSSNRRTSNRSEAIPPPTAAASIPFSPNYGWTTSAPQRTSMAASTNVKGGISIPFPASPGSPAARQTNTSPDHSL